MLTVLIANEIPMIVVDSGVEMASIVKPCLGFVEVGVTPRAIASDHQSNRIANDHKPG